MPTLESVVTLGKIPPRHNGPLIATGVMLGSALRDGSITRLTRPSQ